MKRLQILTQFVSHFRSSLGSIYSHDRDLLCLECSTCISTVSTSTFIVCRCVAWKSDEVLSEEWNFIQRD